MKGAAYCNPSHLSAALEREARRVFHRAARYHGKMGTVNQQDVHRVHGFQVTSVSGFRILCHWYTVVPSGTCFILWFRSLSGFPETFIRLVFMELLRSWGGIKVASCVCTLNYQRHQQSFQALFYSIRSLYAVIQRFLQVVITGRN